MNIQVYENERFEKSASISIDETTTIDNIIEYLKDQGFVSKHKCVSIVISDKNNSCVWLSGQSKIQSIWIEDTDILFLAMNEKPVRIMLPDGKHHSFLISMTKIASKITEVICSYFSIHPHNAWGLFTKFYDSYYFLDPFLSIGDQSMFVDTLYLKQFLFHPSLKNFIISPVSLYFSQYVEFLKSGKFLLSAEDEMILNSKTWYKHNAISNNEETIKTYIDTICGLQSFGIVRYVVRISFSNNTEITNQVIRNLILSSSSLSLSDGNNKNTIVKPYSMLSRFSCIPPYLTLEFSEDSSESWFVFSPHIEEVFNYIRSMVSISFDNNIIKKTMNTYVMKRSIANIQQYDVPYQQKSLEMDFTEIIKAEFIQNQVLSSVFTNQECSEDFIQKKLAIESLLFDGNCQDIQCEKWVNDLYQLSMDISSPQSYLHKQDYFDSIHTIFEEKIHPHNPNQEFSQNIDDSIHINPVSIHPNNSLTDQLSISTNSLSGFSLPNISEISVTDSITSKSYISPSSAPVALINDKIYDSSNSGSTPPRFISPQFIPQGVNLTVSIDNSVRNDPKRRKSPSPKRLNKKNNGKVSPNNRRKHHVESSLLIDYEDLSPKALLNEIETNIDIFEDLVLNGKLLNNQLLVIKDILNTLHQKYEKSGENWSSIISELENLVDSKSFTKAKVSRIAISINKDIKILRKSSKEVSSSKMIPNIDIVKANGFEPDMDIPKKLNLLLNSIENAKNEISSFN